MPDPVGPSEPWRFRIDSSLGWKTARNSPHIRFGVFLLACDLAVSRINKMHTLAGGAFGGLEVIEGWRGLSRPAVHVHRGVWTGEEKGSHRANMPTRGARRLTEVNADVGALLSGLALLDSF